VRPLAYHAASVGRAEQADRAMPGARSRARDAGRAMPGARHLAFCGAEVHAKNNAARGHTRARLREGTMRRQWIGGAGIVLAIAVSGTPASSQQMAQQVAQAAPNDVVASAQFSQDPDLRCDLLEAKRVSGGALLVRWRVINTAGQGGGGGGLVSSTAAKPIQYSFDWNELFYIDPAENKRYQFLTDSGGHKILEVWDGYLEAGKQRLNWAKFPAPPASSTKISISIPRFAPFEDVPLSQ
jgi:hypothetical protein